MWALCGCSAKKAPRAPPLNWIHPNEIKHPIPEIEIGFGVEMTFGSDEGLQHTRTTQVRRTYTSSKTVSTTLVSWTDEMILLWVKRDDKFVWFEGAKIRILDASCYIYGSGVDRGRMIPAQYDRYWFNHDCVYNKVGSRTRFQVVLDLEKPCVNKDGDMCISLKVFAVPLTTAADIAELERREAELAAWNAWEAESGGRAYKRKDL
jgi:hypothetical protein